LGGEVSFHDMALDTDALQRCEPVRSRAGAFFFSPPLFLSLRPSPSLLPFPCLLRLSLSMLTLLSSGGTIDIWVQRESVITVEEAEEGDDLYLQPRARPATSVV
jgi:hypothetical protein